MDFEPSFRCLVEAPLSGLIEARFEHCGSPLFSAYREVLIAYLQCDLDGLAEGCAQVENVNDTHGTSESACVLAIAKLRLAIRHRVIPESCIADVLRFALLVPRWQGEALFVAAMAYEVISDFRAAKRTYQRAVAALEKSGCQRKALKAIQNYVAAETMIHPGKRLIVDYRYLAEKALERGEDAMAGVALNNVSREYQIIGAFEVALKYCNEAIALFRKDFGSVHYYLAVVHRAHLYLNLNRVKEADLDIQHASIAEFQEVKGALQVLRRLRGDPVTALNLEARLTESWRERLANEPAQKLGKLEEILIDFLSDGPKDKFDISTHLYGDRLDFDTRDNRLRNLLSRIRKRIPGLVVFENGKYRISDSVFLKQSERASVG